jgi:hypothetical protein
MKFFGRTLLLLVTLVLAALADNRSHIRTELRGYHEVPAVSTPAHGLFTARIQDNSIDYTLTYSNLQSSPTLFAHIHFGQPDVNGGVMVFLCGPAAATDKGECPSTSGSVTGTIVPADVVGPAGQGITAGEFQEVIRAIRNGRAYVNVHTDAHPGGEIRGNIKTADSRRHN